MPDEPAPKPEAPPAPKKKRRSWLRVFGILLLVLILLGIIGRLMMPMGVRWYVNRTLDRAELYEGRIGDIDIHLWRGAYTIHDVRLNKKTGNVPVPFFAASKVDLAIEWNAILHGKVVGKILLDHPELNFVDAKDDSESQAGTGGPWLAIIRELFPFKINSVNIVEGSVHFRTYATNLPVDVYLGHMDASVDNLTNVRDETTPLITTVKATALAMDQAKFEFDMKLNPFTYKPTFHMTTRLLGLDVTKTNNLAYAYGSFDFKRGWFDLIVELDAKEGELQGYVKPLFRDLKVFSLAEDVKEDTLPQVFWQALIGAAAQILKNQPRDQFGTLIPFTGNVDKPDTDILATVGNVLRNAFIRAYLPKLQGAVPEASGMEFSPGSVTDPMSVGDSP